MPRITSESLTRMALDALEEANAAAEFGPVRRNWATRLALGYLASLPPGRWNSSDDVFRAFWRALADDCTPARTRALGRAIEQIHARAGVKRDADRASFFRDRERAFVRERTTQEARIDGTDETASRPRMCSSPLGRRKPESPA